MPEKFIPKEKKKKAGKIILIIISFFIFVCIIGIAVFLFSKKLKELDDRESATAVNQNINQSITNQPINQNIPLRQIITEEFRDEQGIIKGTAKLTIPAGAVSEDLKVEITAYPKEIYQDYDQDVQILGPVYLLDPKVIDLSESVYFVLSYSLEEFIILQKEIKDLKIGYLKDNKWEVLDAQTDEQNNTISISLDNLASHIYTIIIPLEEESVLQNGELPSSLDSDKDGLTDEEEKLYRTDFLISDTDGDGFSDSQETLNLFSPISEEGGLDTSGLVNLYTNPIFKYSLFYPASWIAQSLDETNGMVIFTSVTGEFVEVVAQENPARLTILDWYAQQAPDTNLEGLEKTTVVNQEAIKILGIEGTEIIYFAYQDKVYGLIYNYGNKVELNFKTTFEMMKNSFKFE